MQTKVLKQFLMEKKLREVTYLVKTFYKTMIYYNCSLNLYEISHSFLLNYKLTN